MLRRFLLPLLLVLSCQVQAATVQLSSGWQSTVSDFNCQTVISAFLIVLGASSGDCGFQAVSTGTNLTFRNAAGAAIANPTVSAVTGWTAPVASGGTNYQPQIDALTGRMIAVESAITAINNKLAASPASGYTLTAAEYAQFSAVMTSASTPYDYQTGGVIFAAVLVPTVSLYLLIRGLMEFHSIVKTGARRIV